MSSSRTKKQNAPSPTEKPFDEMISELITRRKIQQDALLKIKASVAGRQVEAEKDHTRSRRTQKPKP